MNYRQDHPAWIYVRCASVNAAAAFDRLYDLIDEAAGHGFLVRGTSFDHCSGNTLERPHWPAVYAGRSRERSGLKP